VSDIAIQIEGLSKRYRIGVRERYPTIRESLMRAASAPLRAVLSWAAGRNNGTGPGWIWALRDVNVEVKQGEVVGIIGRNGAGKSTLLKVLSGITEPTAGYADIYGRVGSLLEVGTGFHMELTGRENIFMNGAMLGMRRHEIKRKFDEIVAFAEMEEFIDTPVKRYSTGMYMRLAFAVAAHLEPEILVIDEVLAVGDAAFQKKCLGKMGDVARQGRTVLFVSHNMAAIQALCEKTAWLDAGQVRHIGPTSEVVHRYLKSAAPSEGTSFSDRADRQGDGSVRLSSVHIESANQSSTIHTTSRLRVTIDYVSDKPLRRPRFCIDVCDSIGTGIYLLDTRCSDTLIDPMAACGTVVCETAPIHLTPGRCYVNLSVYRGEVMADFVECASYFDVVGDSFYRSGYLPKRKYALCVIRQHWSAAAEDE